MVRLSLLSSCKEVDMTGILEKDDLPPSLRFLKHLVTTLTLTMIVGAIPLLQKRLGTVPPPG